jgi:DUF1365 family protein
LTPVQIVPPRKHVEGIRGTYYTNPCGAWLRILGVERTSTPALYRTRITHLRRAPVHHYFEHRGYSWYVDVDRLPQLPRWLRPFATFEAADHLAGGPNDSLRQRLDGFLAQYGISLNGGKITALMQARVLGHAFSPVTLFWCHDADGVLRHIVAEMHNTCGGRHAYLLPADADRPAMVRKKLHVSPFNDVEGHYLVRAPLPDTQLDVRISLHRENQPAFIVTLRGSRRRAGIGELLWLQVIAPLAPLMGALAFRIQTITLRLRRVPVIAPPYDIPETSLPAAQFVPSTSSSRLRSRH